MVIITKVLKRKDAASIVVAIVVGLILGGAISTVTSELAQQLSGVSVEGAGNPLGWKGAYLQPVVWALLQLLLLEVLIWVYGWLKSSTKSR